MKDILKKSYKTIIFLICFSLILSYPVPYYIFTSGGITDLSKRFEVENGYKQEGSYNLSYVTELNANVLTYLASYLVPSWDLVEQSDYKINDEEECIYVDIKGEVINPSVYKIKKGLRVIDVINLAGGLTEESDTNNINLSKIVTDEMVIVIKSKNNEEVYIDSDVDINNNNNNNNQLIDINTCTIDELLTLPGIGESKANNIIEYRKKNKFNTINDIMNVSGISESLFNKIKEYIKV